MVDTVVAGTWREGAGVTVKRCIIEVINEKKNRKEWEIISMVAYIGNTLLKINTRCLSGYREHIGILLEKQLCFQQNRSTIDTMFMMRA